MLAWSGSSEGLPPHCRGLASHIFREQRGEASSLMSLTRALIPFLTVSTLWPCSVLMTSHRHYILIPSYWGKVSTYDVCVCGGGTQTLSSQPTFLCPSWLTFPPHRSTSEWCPEGPTALSTRTHTLLSSSLFLHRALLAPRPWGITLGPHTRHLTTNCHIVVNCFPWDHFPK